MYLQKIMYINIHDKLIQSYHLHTYGYVHVYLYTIINVTNINAIGCTYSSCAHKFTFLFHIILFNYYVDLTLPFKMSVKQSFNLLKEQYDNLSSFLNPHVDKLAESFHQDGLLSDSEVATIRKPDQQKSKVNLLLDIITEKVRKDDGDDCFDKFITFMRRTKDWNLLDLAKKMSNNQQDIDYVPCVQAEQTESAPSSSPAECEKQRMYIKSFLAFLNVLYICMRIVGD